VPVSPPGESPSTTLALARLGEHTFAYVADEDTHALRTIDVDGGREVAMTRLDGVPSHALLLPDGRVAVALRDVARVEVLEPGDQPTKPLELRCSAPVAAEPIALALTPDARTLIVSSGWGRALGAYDVTRLERLYEVPLAREPRAVVVTDDGRSAYVTHAVGGLVSRVDLAADMHPVRTILLHNAGTPEAPVPGETPVDTRRKFARQALGTPASCQGFALAKTEQPSGRILAPQVLVDPSDQGTSTGYGDENRETEEANVAVLDAATGTPFDVSIGRVGHRFGRGRIRRDAPLEPCLLPRAAAYDAVTRSLLVTCLGTDAVVAYDAVSATPAGAEKQRWRVPGGPTGVVIDPARRRAIVWSQFDRTLSTIPLDGSELKDDEAAPPPALARTKLAPDPQFPVSLSYALGRVLFHSAGDARIAADGRACASCHPDGRDDSLVWSTPVGPRRTIMLAGRLKGSAPYSWEGAEAALEDHVRVTFDRLHGEGGLRGMELEGLLAYLGGMAPPASPPPSPRDGEAIKRGAALFASKDVGCAGCHAGEDGTDGQTHDVQSKAKLDTVGVFNTPSLRYVGGTGPYFHDGRYATLGELLRGGDGMGHTSQLSPDDLNALEAYLRTR
jgi:DNA-binding beta-propeller fold protein YncE/mono/diheme cytochrome c family protein